MIVIGAGPTGLMLAGELARAGVAIEVIERQQAVPCGQSRGGGDRSAHIGGPGDEGLLDAVTQRAIPRESAGWHFVAAPS